VAAIIITVYYVCRAATTCTSFCRGFPWRRWRHSST